jgi:hypothetical protein
MQREGLPTKMLGPMLFQEAGAVDQLNPEEGFALAIPAAAC